RVHEVGVRRRADDPRDAARILEPSSRPRLAGVGRPEHSPAGGDMAARERLARSRIDYVRVTRRHGDRAHRRYGLFIEDRVPVNAPVGRLPETARRRAGVVRVWVTRHAGNGGDAISLGPDVAIPESLIDRGIDFFR